MEEINSEVKVSNDNEKVSINNKRCCDDDQEEIIYTKKQKRDNKRGNRGQNKSRPKPFKESRDVKLCKTLVEGDQENAKNCYYKNCIFIHYIETYLKTKGEDIGPSCCIYSTRGYCHYGLTCRFARSHMDENNHNKVLDTYDKNTKTQTFNQISYELQMKKEIIQF